MLADVDLGWSRVSRCGTVGQVNTSVLVCVFIGGCACLWVCFGPLEGDALWFQCVEVMEYSLEEGVLGRKFGEFGSAAIDDVGDGSAVRVDDIILLWREVPSSKGEANDNCGKFHMGRL